MKNKKTLYKLDTSKEGCTHWLLKEVMKMVTKDCINSISIKNINK
jgi:hypothetical protein